MMSSLVPKLRFKAFSGEWEEKTLDGTADFINEKIKLNQIDLNNYISTENILPDFNGITKASKLPNIANVTKFKKYDVLMSNIRPYLKKVWLSNIDGGVSNDVIIARAKEDNNCKFLLYIMQNDKFIDYIMQGAKGVKMPRGDIALIKKYPIALPKPKEQQKIANTLSSLDSLIEAQNKKVEALKKHKKGLMQQLFPADGQKVPKLRFDGFSGEWENKQLFEIGKIITGTTPSTKKDEYYQNGQYYWVTPTDISESKEINKTKKMLTEKGLKAGRFISKNSLLVTCIASIGKNAILRIDGSCNQQINAISPYENYDVDFLYYMVEEKNYILKENAGQGGMSMLNKNDFSNLYFMFPKDKPEQQKIANTLSSLDSLIESQNKKVEALKKHKKGLMQQMFVGGEVEDE